MKERERMGKEERETRRERTGQRGTSPEHLPAKNGKATFTRREVVRERETSLSLLLIGHGGQSDFFFFF